MEVDYREFLRHAGKYLQTGEILVHGKRKSWRLQISVVGENEPLDVQEILSRPNLSEYGCGCPKADNVYLCKKHGRS